MIPVSLDCISQLLVRKHLVQRIVEIEVLVRGSPSVCKPLVCLVEAVVVWDLI